MGTAAGGLACRRCALSAAALGPTAALRPVLQGLSACGNLYRRVAVVDKQHQKPDWAVFSSSV